MGSLGLLRETGTPAMRYFPNRGSRDRSGSARIWTCRNPRADDETRSPRGGELIWFSTSPCSKLCKDYRQQSRAGSMEPPLATPFHPAARVLWKTQDVIARQYSGYHIERSRTGFQVRSR